jgi:hypothetical protein
MYVIGGRSVAFQSAGVGATQLRISKRLFAEIDRLIKICLPALLLSIQCRLNQDLLLDTPIKKNLKFR